MNKSQGFWRGLFFILMIAALCGGLALPVVEGAPVHAAPQRQAILPGGVVISEFRFRGSGGASDEFVELLNVSNSTINLNGLKLRGSNNAGAISDRFTFTTSTPLDPGQHFLLANIGNVDGTAADGTYSTGITADGGVAITLPDNTIIDQVGLSAGSTFKEGTTLASLTTDTDQSYERRACQDTDDNSADFQLLNPSGPQNMSSSLTPCITVTNVTSSTPNGVYNTTTVPNTIDIGVTFSDVVNVTGVPTLLLETGTTNETATYVSGSGTNTLTFNYVIVAGDTSSDLDYVNSLALSGSVTGLSSSVNLRLPVPSAVGSLGANKNIVIDNSMPPTVTVEQAAGQADPANSTPVNFAVTFSEPIDVATFIPSDITQSGTASPVTWTITDSGDHRVFTLAAVFVGSNGTLIPSIAAGQVTDFAGNSNTVSTSTDNTVDFNDATAPTVTINQGSSQADPTNVLPIRFTVVFSEPINTSSFVVGDITQTGTATGITWNIADSGDHRSFTLSATAVTHIGTIIPTIAANQVTDLVGNNNLASTSTDNTVTFDNTVSVPIVISEFRTTGQAGGNDEFIELYNPTSTAVDISGWKINASSASGSVGTRATIPIATLLRPGQYYLIANNSYSISGVPADLKYSSGIADDGGIALLRPNNTIVDQVGMSTGSKYREGTFLPPLTGNSNRSYERKSNGCQDTNNNSNDFSIASPSNPHNSSSIISCSGGPLATPIPTTLTILSHTPNPSVINELVNVSVRLTGSSLSLNGIKVSITGASTDCTVTLGASGTGSCNIKFTSTGTKTITASYLGDITYLGSRATVSHSVVIATPTKFKTRTPTPAPPPQLLGINEFVPRPGHDWNHDGVVNTGDEYIELINFGVVDVTLGNYSLDDEVNVGSDPYRLPAGTLKPGERIVLYGSQTNLQLSDGGDAVRLLKSNGQLADAYNYSVVRFPDESFCRLPDNGGLDDWNQFCFPTPGLPNSAGESSASPSTTGDSESLCPIADTLPQDFAFAECQPFGNNIWNSEYWDRDGWFDGQYLPGSPGKWPLFGD